MTESVKNELPKAYSESQRNAELIDNWYQSYYLWTKTIMTSQVMAQSFATNSEPRTLTHSSLNNSAPSVHLNTNRSEPSQSAAGILHQVVPIYKVPSLTRRLVAECLDMFYIQCLKVTFVLFFIYYTDIISEESFNVFDFLEDILTEENLNNIRLPVELLFLEVFYVLMSVVVESYCLYRKGFTPGKYMCNLKVISCTEINELITPNHIRVVPGTNLTLKSILMRTCLKNFSIVLLFPTILFFLLPAFVENGQTTYDKVAETIVIENV